MKEHKSLITYILGILTITSFIPLIQSITEFLCELIEIPKGKIEKRIIKLNTEMQDMQMEQESPPADCFGFQYYPPEDEDDWDDEEWEDDCCNHKKIGFIK